MIGAESDTAEIRISPNHACQKWNDKFGQKVTLKKSWSK
jgi:hypothetical protein